MMLTKAVSPTRTSLSARHQLVFVLLTALVITLNPPQELIASDQLTLQTPRGTRVSGWRMAEMSPAEVSQRNMDAARTIRENRWQAELVADSTRTYNSHGYSFQVSLGGPAVHLGPEALSAYLTDGSYEKVRISEAMPGDIVVFGETGGAHGWHTGVVADRPGWCVSKWDDGPLVRHQVSESPYGAAIGLYRKAVLAMKVLPTPQNLKISW